MKRDTTQLFSAALHLYGLFLENDPPLGCSLAAWEELERAAEAAYGAACGLRPDDTAGQRLDTLHEILRATRFVHRGLGVLPEHGTHRTRALRLLKTIISELQQELDHCGDPCWN